MAQSRIQGFGSSNPGGSGGGGSGAYDAPAADGGSVSVDVGGSGKRMEGFGNPRYSGGSSRSAPRSGAASLSSAAWEGAMSVSGTALSGVGTALSGASRCGGARGLAANVAQNPSLYIFMRWCV